MSPLALFRRIRNHAAMASGNFPALFRTLDIKPLPAAISRLLEEINHPDADMARISRLIEATPEIGAQVIKTVNSSLFGLRSPVLSIQHGVNLLGLEKIRSLVLSFAAVAAVNKPESTLFDQEAFWTDSLLRAIFARCLARRHCPDQSDNSFTVMLVSDVALPILLTSWQEYYQPVLAEWLESEEHLSALEERQFGWHHGQAGAWILQHWNFPEEMICYVGLHNRSPQLATELDLTRTMALPVMLAAMLPSSLRESESRASRFIDQVQVHLGIDGEDLDRLIMEAEQGFVEICELFGLCSVGARKILGQVETAVQTA